MQTTSDFGTIVKELKSSFDSQKTKPIEHRIHQIKNIEIMLKSNEKTFADALFKDLHKPFFEAYAAEIGFILSEIRFVLKHLPNWSKSKHVSTPIAHQCGKSYIKPEPLGLVFIISPWNYPLQLTLSPLIGAIAAGNCALIKPSEVASHTSSLLAKLIPRYLGEETVKIIEGDANTTQSLLKEQFDHIFFTGNSAVGKIILQAAANNLTPTTLELGGKSPCIVDEKIDLKICARRIVWGKFINAGQTCIAPDYILVNKPVQKKLLNELKKAIIEFYGPNPELSKDYGRIINEKHMKRLIKLLENQSVFYGGEVNLQKKYMAPTILTNVDEDSAVMKEEIFGPILPVIPVESVDSAIAFINDREKPLALYCFSDDEKVQKKILNKTSSGGVCINDTISHIAIPELPFGGVGNSGFGAYHGQASFNTFSHFKSVFCKNTRIDIPLRYPPYNSNKINLVRWFL